jgi:hypothetical protein
MLLTSTRNIMKSRRERKREEEERKKDSSICPLMV